MTLPTNETPAPVPPPVPQNSPQSPPPVPLQSAHRDDGARNISLTGPWILVLVLVGGFSLLITVAVAKLRVGSLDTPEKIGEFTGMSIGGWGIVTLVICAILSLFKSFRKNSRRLASVAMIVWTLIALGNIGQFFSIVSQRAADSAVTKNAAKKRDDIRRRAAQTTDPREQLELERQLEEVSAKSAKNYSPEARKQFTALLAFLEPYQKLNTAYTKKSLELIEIKGGWMAAYSKSPDDLAAGRAFIKDTGELNQNVLKELDALVKETDRRIQTNDTSSGISIEELKGFKSTFGPNAAYIHKLRTMDAKLLGYIDEILVLLQDNPSLWERHDDDALVHCKDAAFQQKLQTLLFDIQATASQQEALRKQKLLEPSIK